MDLSSGGGSVLLFLQDSLGLFHLFLHLLGLAEHALHVSRSAAKSLWQSCFHGVTPPILTIDNQRTVGPLCSVVSDVHRHTCVLHRLNHLIQWIRLFLGINLILLPIKRTNPVLLTRDIDDGLM